MLQKEIKTLCEKSKKAFHFISNKKSAEKDAMLTALQEAIAENSHDIIEANKKDLVNAQKDGLSKALIDRLTLTEARVQALIDTVKDIQALPDPVGEIVYSKRLPNGITLHQERVPIGVLFCIFESRPNIVIDIASLCLKSGNACILKGGKEARYTNAILGETIQKALQRCPASKDAHEGLVQVIEDTSREKTPLLLKQSNFIDIVVPRGGSALIQYVCEHSTIPVIKHDAGLCHVFIDESANQLMAESITVNAKVQRPGVCNAAETLLIHQAFPHAKKVIDSLIKAGVMLFGDEKTIALHPEVKKATPSDWETEYLDMRLAIKFVQTIDEAIEWINRYGSQHTDTIITENYHNAEQFLNRVDSACVFVNASTRFSDGGCFGLGAEVGISTQKLHVRGPMGIKDLTCLKYKAYGDGQIRT